MEVKRVGKAAVGNQLFIKRHREAEQQLREALDRGDKEMVNKIIEDLINLWVEYGYVR